MKCEASSMKCEVWSVDSDMGMVQREGPGGVQRRVECKMWSMGSVKCGVWSVEWGTGECKMWSVRCIERTCNVWSVECTME